jgi:hypothetical protein
VIDPDRTTIECTATRQQAARHGAALLFPVGWPEPLGMVTMMR